MRIDAKARAFFATSLSPFAGVTSEEEYEEDAWAHQTDEGRGDRRNVQGELHASDEP